MSTVISIIGAIVLLGVLIVLHELGHYIAGRCLRLPVTEFSVGFGPKLFGWHRGGIDYSLRALPLGGYCAFDDEVTDGRPSFMQTPAWRRLVTFMAGPAMNLIAAYLLTVVLFVAIGMPFVSNIIHSVEQGMPADGAGLLAGDAIVAVNGVQTESPSELIAQHEGRIELTVERDGERIVIPVETVYDQELQRSRVGITMLQDFKGMPIGQSLSLAGTACVNMVKAMGDYLGGLFTGRQSADDLMGLVGTVTVISSQAQQGFAYSLKEGFGSILNLAVVISLNLGLINLLPLPALDGGRIVFSLIELIARRPVPQKVESVIHSIGFVLLFGLMVLLIFKDVFGLVTGSLPI